MFYSAGVKVVTHFQRDEKHEGSTLVGTVRDTQRYSAEGCSLRTKQIASIWIAVF